MKKLIYVSFLIGMAVACGPQEENTYHIKGTIEGMEDQMVYHQKMGQEDVITVDSTKSENGSFSFKGEIDLPEQHYITFDDLDAEITFFNEPSEITLAGESDSLQKLKVKGSESQELFEKYQTRIDQLQQQQRDIYYQYQEARSANDQEKMNMHEKQYLSLDSTRNDYSEKFIKDHSGTTVSAFIALRSAYTYDLPELKNIVEGFDSAIDESYYVKQIKKRIEKLEKTAIGEVAPGFTMNNPEGEPISLSDFRGQYVLLDFWAAWCGPCRAENPNIVEAYQKYKDEGFTVFGVSLDNNREEWLKAIEKDNLTWPQVSDLQGWDNEVSNQYGVMSIPQSYLLDEEGVIVAKNLRGEELHQKLDEIFNP
ncbi:MAG: redoxin domain-containing protein [Bacteroidota bacterium]